MQPLAGDEVHLLLRLRGQDEGLCHGLERAVLYEHVPDDPNDVARDTFDVELHGKGPLSFGIPKDGADPVRPDRPRSARKLRGPRRPR